MIKVNFRNLSSNTQYFHSILEIKNPIYLDHYLHIHVIWHCNSFSLLGVSRTLFPHRVPHSLELG